MQQHSHRTTPFEKKEFPLVIICDQVKGPANLGSLFRVSDAFGVKELVFCGHEVDLESQRMKRTSRETHLKVVSSVFDSVEHAIHEYREAGYTIVALEITKTSNRLSDYKWEAGASIALVIGNEQHGISEKALSMCDETLHIELYGENSSINVSHATAIALYQLTQNR